jgi:sugar-specific transcriptional regulator TrmB/DNA-binding CsgD family transcriptional regulator
MASNSNGQGVERPLGELGITESQEKVYRWLLVHGNATASDAGRALSYPSSAAQRLLESLEAKGLATHTPERPRRYIPASPDVALRALITQRQKNLYEAEVVAEELQKEMGSQHREEHEQVVELITSLEMERHLFGSIVKSAQQEVICLVKPPMRSTRIAVPLTEDRPAQEQEMKRGIRYRSVVDTEFMSLPGGMARVTEEIESGEEHRVFPELPFKLIMADRKIALVPLSLKHADDASLLVKSSALLDALYLLFELIWEKSSPLHLSGTQLLKAGDARAQLPEKIRELVSLMAAGMNDKSIYMELGVSRRTHQTHMSELMQALNARTRFQAGWLAARALSENDKQG